MSLSLSFVRESLECMHVTDWNFAYNILLLFLFHLIFLFILFSKCCWAYNLLCFMNRYHNRARKKKTYENIYYDKTPTVWNGLHKCGKGNGFTIDSFWTKFDVWTVNACMCLSLCLCVCGNACIHTYVLCSVIFDFLFQFVAHFLCVSLSFAVSVLVTLSLSFLRCFNPHSVFHEYICFFISFYIFILM